MEGHCLCGSVRFTASDARGIGACHCAVCRRWGGGPLLAFHCGPGVVFQSADPIEPTKEGTVEAWRRAATNPMGGCKASTGAIRAKF